ncbi:OB-fold domain-containing protein [Hyphomicrobium sp.]|uniref:Zn-ribbon domain-containing OB-fold protein n=1 Tax=Hyphomicrobium sp. TaxID=82 RepID=UPI001D6C5863|nr:OB-fold domain-containing protein [Hyphomicrobium sp.]MBY0558791.1 OB-fold domain-containing protein [Hyphomicrobium sp.]
MPAGYAFVADEFGEMTLLASKSRTTGLGVFPRLPATAPSASQYEDLEIHGHASLYSFTVIHPNPKSGLAPFVLAMADFPQEVRVLGRLECALTDVAIGMKLSCRPASDNASGFVFVPAAGAA